MMKTACSICFLVLLMHPVFAYNGGFIKYPSVDRPITTEKLFRECNPVYLSPNKTRSRLCDIWDEHIHYLEGRLEQACTSAGEKIYQTVSDVEGFYLKSPQGKHFSTHLHTLGVGEMTAELNYVSSRNGLLY